MSIGVIVAVGLVGLVALFLMRRDERVEMPRIARSSTATDSVEAALQAGRKIDAIKLYREEHRVGLREAKEAVEAIDRELRTP